jgi:hypothetical protein
MPKTFETEFYKGKTYESNNRKVTLFSKSSSWIFPGNSGGVIWNRPASILVEEPDGNEIVLPVIDVTRRLLWMILGTAAVFAVAGVVFKPNK